MIIREATIEDIKQIQIVRNSVIENALSNPELVSDEDCKDYITQRGKAWVCEIDQVIVGFSIVDLINHSIWALFLKPDYERRGIGKKLHDIMLDWYFVQTRKTVWLSTSANTRAEAFYRHAGWSEIGIHKNGEIKFEMNYIDWTKRSKEIANNKQ